MESNGHQLTDADCEKGQQQYDQVRNKEADLTTFMVAYTDEEQNKGTHANTGQTNGIMANGSEQFDFSCSESAIDAKKDNEQDAGYQQPDECLGTSKDGGLNSQLTSNQYLYDPGESSFSAMTHSNIVAPSGSIPYSRTTSDGSTTSVHSFVFPILNSDWNSSPMTLIQTDKRHDIVIEKHCSWWRCLLCCG
ncbi:hypothetical protein AQUCO_00600391v1 [Aquilegia coerulea]|uniref:Uncharacterized protein n=1 Tax=Aquilegia coerulea TaxID=218851 RepID=A0A2G5EPF7_AQUCA|nr:hypothetical protein AQUCO_00600391v1 [Aquilegia coerulea]